MKVQAPSLEQADLVERSWMSVYADLFKARLTFLVLLTTLVGFYVGAGSFLQVELLWATLGGTALLACGASALNQYLEREHDALMRRTETRPLPAGRLQPSTVLLLGAAMALAGMLWLALQVNLLTCLLGGLTLVSYLFVYTPLKRVTWLNTTVGAVPGALPPLIGWAAAGNGLSLGGWSLFAILFFWQIPHFLAIAWIYRDDYERAGFVMLPSLDPAGERTGHTAVSHTLGLCFVSLCPVVLGLAGKVYAVGALGLGLLFLVCAVRFAAVRSMGRARWLFFVSILYLPLLLGLMVLDKVNPTSRTGETPAQFELSNNGLHGSASRGLPVVAVSLTRNENLCIRRVRSMSGATAVGESAKSSFRQSSRQSFRQRSSGWS